MSSTENDKKMLDEPTHLLFPSKPSPNMSDAIFYVPVLTNMGHVKGSIYIGGLYKNYPWVAEQHGVSVKKMERFIRMRYHPIHLTASLSHEELHRVLMKLGEISASYGLDKKRFGSAGTRQPSGMPSETFMKLSKSERLRRIRA